MKALVTGASGFIGGKLCQRLKSRGWDVVAAHRGTLSDTVRQLASAELDVSGAAGLASLERELGALKPDIVFHLATYYVTEHKPSDIDPLIQANITFPPHLVEAAVRSGVRGIVAAGSAWQRFHSDAYRPMCLHSATKQAFSDLLLYYSDAGLVKATNIFIHDTYGEDDPRKKLFYLLRQQLGRSEPLMMSEGMQQLDCIHADDLTAALEIAGRRMADDSQPVPGELNICTERPLSLREIVGKFEEAYQRRIPIDWGKRPYRAREVMHPWYGGDRLAGWRAEVTLEAGLARLVEFDRKAGLV